MPHGDAAFSQRGQTLGGEDLVHQTHVLPRTEYPVVVHRDPGALLTTVLQGVEPVIGQMRQIAARRRVNAEDAAGLVKLLHALSGGA